MQRNRSVLQPRYQGFLYGRALVRDQRRIVTDSTKKAQTFLKRNRDEYRKAQIRKVEYNGTIDA
jgi:hypothetical protein